MAYVIEAKERGDFKSSHLPQTKALKNGAVVVLDVSRPELVGQMRDILNNVIAEGMTYPHEEQLTDTGFRQYFLSHDCFSVTIKALPCADQMGDWSSFKEGDVVGCFYIKPNFPGRSSHICNAGFLTRAEAQGQGIGRFMSTWFVPLAKELGYQASFFNLVYKTNARSHALWESMGYTVIGTVPRAGRLSNGDYVDAIQYYKDFTSS